MSKQLRVAEVLSESDILVSAGRNASINVGDKFIVYQIGPEIEDPETKESLGSLELKKGMFLAVDVQEMVTVARVTQRTVRRTQKLGFPGLMNLGGPFYEQEVLDISERVKMDVTTPTYSDDLTIRKGDLVRRTQE